MKDLKEGRQSAAGAGDEHPRQKAWPVQRQREQGGGTARQGGFRGSGEGTGVEGLMGRCAPLDSTLSAVGSPGMEEGAKESGTCTTGLLGDRTHTYTEFSENCIAFYRTRPPLLGTSFMAGPGLNVQSLSKCGAGFKQRKPVI